MEEYDYSVLASKAITNTLTPSWCYLNHQEDCVFLPPPSKGYNHIGLLAGRLYEQKSEKPSEQTPDQPKIPSDIIPRKKPFVD